jgi:hypothetical protein
MSSPNGTHETLIPDESLSIYLPDIDNDSDVLEDVECVYCCRIVGSSPCFCSAEEDSDMIPEETDSEPDIDPASIHSDHY